MPTLAHYLTLSAILFSIGVTGVMTHRNLLVILMSIELMLNAANITFIAFSRFHGAMGGQAIAFFVITLAAAEVSVGLAIIVAIFRRQGTVDAGELRYLKDS